MKNTYRTLLIAAILLISSSASFLVIGRVKDQNKKDVGEALETVLTTTQRAAHLWLRLYSYHIEELAASEEVVAYTKELLNTPRSKDALLASAAQAGLRAYCKPALEKYGDLGIFVIAPDYTSLASMRDANVGTKNLIAEQRENLIKKVFAGETRFIPTVQSDVPLPGLSGSLVENAPTMFMAAPVHDEKGRVIAAFTLRLDARKDFTSIAELGRVGQTGETYAFDSNGTLITESRFVDQLKEMELIEGNGMGAYLIRISDPGVNLIKGERPEKLLDKSPLTQAVADAVKGSKGVHIQGYRDYRGVKVMGVWLWDELLGVGLTTQVDYDEALRPYHAVKWVIMILFGGMVAFFLLVLLLLVRAFRREQKTQKVRESEIKHRAIYQWTRDAMMVFRPGGTYVSANPATIQMFRCASEEEFLTKGPADISPEYQPGGARSSEIIEQVMSMVLDRGSHFLEWKHRRLDGEEFIATVLLTKMDLDGEEVIQATVRDITETKKAEQAIKEAAEMKAAFTSMVSHELRTPLAPIREGANIVLKGMVGEVNKEQKHFLEIVVNSVDRLGRLINDVLDFQKLEAGKMVFDLQDNDINEVVEEVRRIMVITATQQNLDLSVELDNALPVVKFDRDKIVQVLTNLVNNALKFTDEGGIVIKTCLEGNVIHVMVQDTGTGIKQEDMPKLFESFEQLSIPGKKKAMGTGLGLAINKEIINRHKGKIWVESEFGNGSTFHFVLPIAERRV